MENINKYIPEVQNYEENLYALSEKWNLLSLLGQMSNIGMDMSDTRKAFSNLSEELLKKLSLETIKKLSSEISSKAQVAIDILIRNLFERTADIGFLATDDDIREYLLCFKENNLISSEQEKKCKKAELIKRFKEYVSKYSVYENIILLDVDGNIVAQLDETSKIKQSNDPLIEESIATSREFVETFRYSDLNPKAKKSLIYSYRITKSNDSTDIMGVLCLLFKFEDEMEGIFKNLLSEEDWSTLLLLDKDGIVISSSDMYHIPLGAKMELVLEDSFRVVKFGGREYIAKSAKTKGYQGFFGLGWYGHTMIPLENSFKKGKKREAVFDTRTAELLKNSNVFPDDLKNIPMQAEKIQKRLDLTVWNGNVQIANTKSGDNSFSKSLLNEISRTGAHTKKVFEESIANLNQTVIGSYLDDVVFMASLAIDIMDRNLYERANDCRWWALRGYFRDILSTEEINSISKENLVGILKIINNLYTVYTNIVIFDKNQTVIATSNDMYKNLIGTKLQNQTAYTTLSLKDSQKYLVSPFEKSYLYGNESTYIYYAPIFGKKEDSVGGIGIVFDATPQFAAMLQDCINDKNSFALFCDRDANIIASTNEKFKIGERLSVKKEFFELKQGESYSAILEYEDSFFVVGSKASKGYREYKTIDGYGNDIFAIVFMKIGDIRQEQSNKDDKKTYSYPRTANGEEGVDISTFYIGGRLFGIESHSVVCALENQDVTAMIGSDVCYIGVVTYSGKTVAVASLSKYLGTTQEYDKNKNQIVIIQTLSGDKQILFGLVIDMVYDSPEIPKRAIEYHAEQIMGNGTLVKGVVKPDIGCEKGEMLSILDANKIYRYLINK